MSKAVKWIILIVLLGACNITLPACSISTKGVKMENPGAEIKIDTNLLNGGINYVA